MSYSHILHEYAQEDYESSLDWYANQSHKAAENFVKAVEDALKKISESPYRWHNRYKNFYELSLKKYPFTVIYTIEENNLIFITAIYHNKRNPKKKYRKI